LLIAAAERLRESVRPEDTVARLGGDEFTILLEGIVDRGGAARAAERISRSMQAPFTLDGREIFTGVSIGIALTDTVPEETEDLLKNADLALYSAKRKGRNRYEFFEEELNAQLREHLELEGDLRRAVEREEFIIYYQPKISINTGEIVSLEALVRWEHPKRGLLEPNEFLPVAEESNLIVRIGEWVLDEVCRQGWVWQEHYPEDSTPRVCTNISPRQFVYTNLVDRVAEALNKSGLEAGRLSLEIEEGVLMEDAEANVEKLTALNDLGIHIVIDDFGTAYSSLAQLKNFPLNILKIDRSLVIKLGEEPEDKAIVAAMIQLAQALGWAVTAQGVENYEQLAMLRELGCDIVQGYYFTRPVTAEEATAFLEEYSQHSALDSPATRSPRED
jgi:predicted signal transduction protein with EAL and GGDEF domain